MYSLFVSTKKAEHVKCPAYGYHGVRLNDQSFLVNTMINPTMVMKLSPSKIGTTNEVGWVSSRQFTSSASIVEI